MPKPEMLDLVTAESGTVLSNGVIIDLHVQGSGPPLLLLHGLEGAERDTAFIERMARGYSVWSPTHPGFGLSPSSSVVTTVDDLAYLYLDLLERFDLRDVTVVGLQFGGWIACEIAIRSCDRIRDLVLVDSVGIKVGGREDRDIADIFALARSDVDSRRFHREARNSLRDLPSAPLVDVLHLARNEEALASYGWQPYMHNPHLRQWLGRISVPSLVVWGEHDRIVSREYGRNFAESIPGADFRVLDESAHLPQIEQPEDLASLISDWKCGKEIRETS